MIVLIHTALGAIALLTGAWNLALRKGTRRHRYVGWVYAGSMVALLITSFSIFELFGGFGAFHIMSLVSAGTLGMAIYAPLRRHNRPGWLEEHYMWISYSYIGLVMATGSHLFEYVPGWPVWLRIATFWLLPVAVGTVLVYTRKGRIFGELGKRHQPPHEIPELT